MKKFDWNELVPVYGAFHVFLGWETRGNAFIRKWLPLVITLTILKSFWLLLRNK